MAYSAFARYYDRFTDDVDYPVRAEYFSQIIKTYKDKCELVLDLACGTGSLAVELSRLGYEVIGVDGSPEMLSRAAEKNVAAPRPILYLCQDMTRLDLYGTVEVTICALDSVNHIASPAKLQKAFDRVGLFTEPGGLFLFDVNTPYKHREILGSNCFAYEQPGVLCVWRNTLLEDDLTVEIALDFFEREQDGRWSRTGECLRERAYTREELTALLDHAGFELLDVFGEGGFAPPTPDAQRQIYVARRRSPRI